MGSSQGALATQVPLAGESTLKPVKPKKKVVKVRKAKANGSHDGIVQEQDVLNGTSNPPQGKEKKKKIVKRIVKKKQKKNSAPTSTVSVEPPLDVIPRVMAFCDWNTRVAVFAISKYYRDNFQDQDPTWRDFCDFLAQDGVYCPRDMLISDWKKYFLDLYPIRTRWQPPLLSPNTRIGWRELGQNGVVIGDKFTVGVGVRFCPARYGFKEEPDPDNVVALPLHQKLQLIRVQRKCNTNEAMKFLWSKKRDIAANKKKDGDSGGSGVNGHGVSGAGRRGSQSEKGKGEKVFDPWQDAILSEDEELGGEGEEKSDNKNGNGETKKKNTDTNNKNDDPKKESKEENGGKGEEEELDKGAQACVLAVQNSQIVMFAPGVGVRSFNFKYIYDAQSTQDFVYNSRVSKFTADFLNGQNVSIMCYGQTGSGKTFTMFGPDEATSTRLQWTDREKIEGAARPVGSGTLSSPKDDNTSSVWSLENDQKPNLNLTESAGLNLANGIENIQTREEEKKEEVVQPHKAGIVPRVCTEIMNAIVARRSQSPPIEATLHLSYIEVYGEEVVDLINGGQLVGPWHGVAVRSVLQGAAQVEVEDREALEKLLLTGERTKRRAATAMNERSSRAHSLLFFSLKQRHSSTGVSLTSQLCLADLGGSEQLKKSKATGERLQEAVSINLGLLALKECIRALVRRQSHVPYQDSKLTMLLSQALGGNARTLVLVTASMEPSNAVETLNTLRFAESCRRVENIEGVSSNSMDDVVKMIEAEIKEVEALVRRKERWEVQRRKRVDVDEFGKEKVEWLTVTVPVGAEEERARLEALLERKRALFGAVAF